MHPSRVEKAHLDLGELTHLADAARKPKEGGKEGSMDGEIHDAREEAHFGGLEREP